MAVRERYTYSDIAPKYSTPAVGASIWSGDTAIESNEWRGTVLYGYDTAYDISAIKQSLINLFLIEKLEVPGKPDLGNPLSVKVFELFDTFSQSIVETSIRVMIEAYEPRVDINSVRVTSMEELNRLIIEVDYYVIIDNRVIGDTVYIPLAHNTRSYIDARGITYKAQE